MVRKIIGFDVRQRFFVVLTLLFFLPSCIKKKESSKESRQQRCEEAASPCQFAALSVEDIRALAAGSSHCSFVDEKDLSISHNVTEREPRSVYEQEAKWPDIPTSFDIVPVIHGACESSVTLALPYQSYLSRESLKEFYRVEMERCGWNQQICFHGYETVMVFAKPKKTAIIIVRSVPSRSFRDRRERSEIMIYVQK
jgi:hypothetical protein